MQWTPGLPHIPEYLPHLYNSYMSCESHPSPSPVLSASPPLNSCAPVSWAISFQYLISQSFMWLSNIIYCQGFLSCTTDHLHYNEYSGCSQEPHPFTTKSFLELPVLFCFSFFPVYKQGFFPTWQGHYALTGHCLASILCRSHNSCYHWLCFPYFSFKMPFILFFESSALLPSFSWKILKLLAIFGTHGVMNSPCWNADLSGPFLRGEFSTLGKILETCWFYMLVVVSKHMAYSYILQNWPYPIDHQFFLVLASDW